MIGQRIESVISVVLIIGTLLSLLFVFSGGVMYLQQHGAETMQMEFANYKPQLFSLSFSAFNMINIGLAILVATQLLRVIMLVFFYLWQRNYYFTFISLFISIVLIYSTLYPFLTV